MDGAASCVELAKKLGVSAGAIRDIIHRKTWRHVA